MTLALTAAEEYSMIRATCKKKNKRKMAKRKNTKGILKVFTFAFLLSAQLKSVLLNTVILQVQT